MLGFTVPLCLREGGKADAATPSYHLPSWEDNPFYPNDSGTRSSKTTTDAGYGLPASTAVATDCSGTTATTSWPIASRTASTRVESPRGYRSTTCAGSERACARTTWRS